MIRPFIIFAQDRTGSTTLLLLLNCHPAIKCLFEPFSPGNLTPYAGQCETLRHSNGVEAAMQWLWRGCNGIKHVWKSAGWPFEDAPDDNRRVLLSGATILFLTRRNALRRAISGQISEQMGVWVPTKLEDWDRIRGHAFAPLNIDRLQSEISASSEKLYEYRHVLAASSVPWREWAYEDLFSNGLEPGARLAAAQDVCAFLGLPPVTEPARLEKMRGFFDPAATGFQNQRAYEKIPNIQEVEEELGSDATGHVFGE